MMSDVRFGVISTDSLPIMLVRNETIAGAWRFNGAEWVEDKTLLNGLELDGKPIYTSLKNRDRGVRLRDVNNGGVCELIVGNESQNAVFGLVGEREALEQNALRLAAGDEHRGCGRPR